PRLRPGAHRSRGGRLRRRGTGDRGIDRTRFRITGHRSRPLMDLQSLVILVVAAAVTVVSALIAFPLLRRAGIVDIPSHRSSHTQVTVRGGAIAIGSGITVATVLALICDLVEHGVFGL